MLAYSYMSNKKQHNKLDKFWVEITKELNKITGKPDKLHKVYKGRIISK